MECGGVASTASMRSISVLVVICLMNMKRIIVLKGLTSMACQGMMWLFVYIYIYVPQVTVSKYFSNNSNVKKKKNSDNNVNNTA